MVKKYRKSIRKRKQSKKRSTYKRTYKRPIYGGNFGPASWQPTFFNPYTMNSVNSYNNDPSSPNNGNLSARNIGGKSLKRYLKNRTLKKGGSFGAGPPVENNPAFAFGTTSGATVNNSLFSGTGIPTSGYVFDNPNYSKIIA
jgi:uncharacterized Zn-finger protein